MTTEKIPQKNVPGTGIVRLRAMRDSNDPQFLGHFIVPDWAQPGEKLSVRLYPKPALDENREPITNEDGTFEIGAYAISGKKWFEKPGYTS